MWFEYVLVPQLAGLQIKTGRQEGAVLKAVMTL